MHTRATVMGRNECSPFWNGSTDFSIEWQPCHEQAKNHPVVARELTKMSQRYPIVKVEFRDC